MNKGIRLFSVVWSMGSSPSGIQLEQTVEAAHSRRFLYDQIRAGEVNNGKQHYVKIQELETPMIDLDFFKNLFSGEFTTSPDDQKLIESHAEQAAYILQLIRCMAVRYSEAGKVVER